MNRTAYEQQKVQVISVREHTQKMDRLQKELSNMISLGERKHKKVTAVLEQRLELLQMKINDSVSRETDQKSMYETMLSALR